MQIYSLIAHFYFIYLNDFLKFHFSNLFYEHSLMNVHSYEHGRASCWVLLAIMGWFFLQGSFPSGCIFPVLIFFCFLSPLLISGALFTFCRPALAQLSRGQDWSGKLRLAGLIAALFHEWHDIGTKTWRLGRTGARGPRHLCGRPSEQSLAETPLSCVSCETAALTAPQHRPWGGTRDPVFTDRCWQWFLWY